MALARRIDRRGWGCVAVITGVVAISWGRFLNAPLGDNHIGRVGGRYALHIRNLYDDGLIGSSWSASWKPYVFGTYAHHPPLLNLLDAAVGLLPGSGAYQVTLAPHLLALLALPAGAALLRALDIGWAPTLLSLGAMASTGYYWLHSPVMFDIGTILFVSAAIAWLRRAPVPSRRLVWAASGAAALATLGSWPGIAFTVVLVAWLVVTRRADGHRDARPVLPVAAAAAVGTAASLTFMFGIDGWSALADQAETRTGSIGLGEFVRSQWDYARTLLPRWYLVLYPVAVIAGALCSRTRFWTLMSAVMCLGWVFGLRQGAYVHDYWAYLLLIPGLVGIAVAADVAAGWARRTDARMAMAAAAVIGLGIAASFTTKAFGDFATEHRDRPADAGRLATQHRPADDQRIAWHVGTGGARWLAYHWDRPLVELTADRFDEAAPDELVFVKMVWLPEWLPPSAVNLALDSRGDYAVFDIATLRQIHDSHPA